MLSREQHYVWHLFLDTGRVGSNTSSIDLDLDLYLGQEHQAFT